jgi:preprotein translocase subunit SecG
VTADNGQPSTVNRQLFFAFLAPLAIAEPPRYIFAPKFFAERRRLAGIGNEPPRWRRSEAEGKGGSTMVTIVSLVHVLVCIVLILVILLQAGKGADLGAMLGGGGANSLFGSSGAGTFLTKLTSGTAITFMITCLILAYMSAHEGAVTGHTVTRRGGVPTAMPGATAPSADENAPGAPAEPENAAPAAAPAANQNAAPAPAAPAPAAPKTEAPANAAPAPAAAPPAPVPPPAAAKPAAPAPEKTGGDE